MAQRIFIFFIFFSLIIPFDPQSASAKFYYAGWLPFWQDQKGAQDIALNLEKLHEVSPFSYTVNTQGGLVDDLHIDSGIWPGWISAAQGAGVKIIPTIAWFNGPQIQKILSNTKARRAQENAITALVKTENFDGVDIDYEGRATSTKPYFSLFIKGLALRLHSRKKMLSCTITAQTPESSYDRESLKNLRVDDFAVLNAYCDEVRVMAYDQGDIDLNLDAVKGNGQLYAPVADTDWVQKVIQSTLRGVTKNKIMLGIPTYGYEYQATWSKGVISYDRLRSLDFFTAMDLADRVGATVGRNNAGELSFTYATSTFVQISSILQSRIVSTLPLALYGSNFSGSVERFASFPDATSIAQKIALAKKYGLRGTVLFKLDGGADPLIWNVMK